MRTLTRSLIWSLVCAVALTTASSSVDAGADKWMDGKTTFKFAGLDPHFDQAADACKAGVEDLAKHGNKKTYDSVKEGTSSTMMTCMLKESDGSAFEQANVVSKILECPATTTARSSDNSGNWSAMKCHCDDKKKGCPAPTPAKK